MALSESPEAQAQWTCKFHEELERDARAFDGCGPETLFHFGSVFELITRGFTSGLHFVNAGDFALVNEAAFFTIQAPSDNPRVIACLARHGEQLLLLHVAPVTAEVGASRSSTTRSAASVCGLTRLMSHTWSPGERDAQLASEEHVVGV